MNQEYYTYYSFFSSLVLLLLSIFPSNRLLQSQVSSVINISKSIITCEISLSHILHHITTLTLSSCYLYLSLRSDISDSIIEEFFIISNTNISTIFLSLRYIKKSILIDVLFLLSFSYYRGKYGYHYLKNGFESVNYLCNSNEYCLIICDKSLFILLLLNIYWYYKILIICYKKCQNIK